MAALGLERQHRQLLDAQSVARIGSWEWDLAADTLECSEELERIFDAVPGSLTSVQRVRQCVHPDDCSGFDAVVQAALLSHEPFLWVGRSVQRDGTVRMIESRGRAIDDRDGTNMLGTAQDITERQHAEQALVAAHARAVAALRLKSQFMANMNHELRTPLNGLIGISDLLAATDLSADQRDFVGALQVSSTALLTVISDILDFSKIEAGTIALQNEPFALHALVENVCAVVAPGAAAKTIQLTQRIDEGLPAVVHGDANRVRQVLTNLANNAVKFTPEGQIAIRVGESRLRGGRPCIRFEVIDTGIGIEPQGLKSIFESFAQADGSTTRPYGGSGLGLTIARDLTTLMGGEIGVDSSPGHGSTFWFSVPAPHLRDPATMEPQSSLPARTCKTPSGVWSSWNSSGSTATERRLATRATATTWTKHAGTGGDVRAISGRASRSVGATVAYARLGAVELRPLGPSST
ncbi:MAG TPA: ATP-binding protein [Solirubrobacteraceae bacterium]